MLGATREREQTRVPDAPWIQECHRPFDKASADTPIPEIRADGQWSEKAEAAPNCNKVRSNQISLAFRSECRPGIHEPARADQFPSFQKSVRIGQPNEGAKRQPENPVCLGQVCLSKRTN